MSKPTRPTPWWAIASTAPRLTPAQVPTITLRGLATLAALASTLAAAVWWLLIATAPEQVSRVEGGLLGHQQSNDALIGGCGPLYSFPDATADSGIVPDKTAAGLSNRLGYRTTVPMRGQFWDKPIDRHAWMPADENKPVAEMALRNQWDGDMVVYYTHAIPEDDITTLTTLARKRPDLRLFVLPWEQRLRGPLPQGRELAFVTWNTSQTCHTLSVPALLDFREAAPATEAPGYDGTKPPILRHTPPLSVDLD